VTQVVPTYRLRRLPARYAQSTAELVAAIALDVAVGEVAGPIMQRASVCLEVPVPLIPRTATMLASPVPPRVETFHTSRVPPTRLATTSLSVVSGMRLPFEGLDVAGRSLRADDETLISRPRCGTEGGETVRSDRSDRDRVQRWASGQQRLGLGRPVFINGDARRNRG
jgi:hypothetical protein